MSSIYTDDDDKAKQRCVLGMMKVSYSHSIVTMTVSCALRRYSDIFVENRDFLYTLAFVGILPFCLV